MNLDVLVFTAHPDDAEIGMGGTIAKFTGQDYKVGIVDLTQGELGTRGTSETRYVEATNSGKILGITYRNNLKVEDGNVRVNKSNLNLVIAEIRKTRPKIIFAPYFNDRHPDHIGAGLLIKEAFFYSGLPKIITFDNEIEQVSYRPNKLFYFLLSYEFTPTFINDISRFFDKKMNSIYAYETQFHNPNSTEPETFISQPAFLEFLKARAKFYGFKIGKDYGEPFFCEEFINYDFKNILR